jgi:hypothetical protein
MLCLRFRSQFAIDALSGGGVIHRQLALPHWQWHLVTGVAQPGPHRRADGGARVRAVRALTERLRWTPRRPLHWTAVDPVNGAVQH